MEENMNGNLNLKYGSVDGVMHIGGDFKFEQESIVNDIKEMMEPLIGYQEKMPYNGNKKMPTIHDLKKNGHEKIVNNLLYGTTAPDFGYMPSQPIGGNSEDSYLLTKMDKN